MPKSHTPPIVRRKYIILDVFRVLLFFCRRIELYDVNNYSEILVRSFVIKYARTVVTNVYFVARQFRQLRIQYFYRAIR